MLFNEPKLLKFAALVLPLWALPGFSALQRAEIAEILVRALMPRERLGFSALQRAEIAEIRALMIWRGTARSCFSALQRAEIAEIFTSPDTAWIHFLGFSALQRAEIAEIVIYVTGA